MARSLKTNTDILSMQSATTTSIVVIHADAMYWMAFEVHPNDDGFIPLGSLKSDVARLGHEGRAVFRRRTKRNA